MARCYWCGKTVSDDEAAMLNVLLAVGRGYARQGRRLFHRTCAAQAKARCRREAGIILLITVIVALGTFAWWQEIAIPILASIIGGVIALVTFLEYS